MREAAGDDKEAEEIAGQSSSERFVIVEKNGIRIGLVTLTLCRRDGRVVLDATEITACHVLGYLNGKPHVIVPVSYPVEKETDREELLAAEARILKVLSMEP